MKLIVQNLIEKSAHGYVKTSVTSVKKLKRFFVRGVTT